MGSHHIWWPPVVHTSRSGAPKHSEGNPLTDSRLEHCTRLTAWALSIVLVGCETQNDGALTLPEDEPDATSRVDGGKMGGSTTNVMDASPHPLDAATDARADADAHPDVTTTLPDASPPIRSDVTSAPSLQADAGNGDPTLEDTGAVPPTLDAGVGPDESMPPSESTTDSAGAPDAASLPPSSDVLDASTPLDASTAQSALDAGWPAEPSCVYQSPPVPPEPILDAGADAGDAGPPPGPHVQVLSSPYLGPYLADHAGYSLYIYTADLPGDCQSPPISNCYDDCAEAWPIFDAGARELVEALDPTVFGSFLRDDGAPQTTYYGWPLYYYKKDLEPQISLGQGKGKIWFLAEQVLPNLVQMRAPEAAGGVKYLADGRGHTLYAYDGDGIGTDSHPPHVECVSECLNGITPFAVRSLRAVTTLEPDDLSIFVRPTGDQQVSFRGQALYLFDADVRSGDMNGLLREGFRLVEP